MLARLSQALARARAVSVRGVAPGPANSDKSRSTTRRSAFLGCTVGSVGTVVDNSVQPVNELALRRLRHAIAAEDDDEEEQLNGVLRMLGAKIPDKKTTPLVRQGTGRSSAPS